MCGRYYRAGDKQAIAEAFRAGLVDDLPSLEPEYNIPPTSIQPVLRQSRETSGREVTAMRWGLVGFGTQGPDPKRATFNARSENLEKSSLWRNPLHKRRCLIPVSGYYEWRNTKDNADRKPFRFSPADPLAFYALAGLWDAWKNPEGIWLQSMAIITVEANPLMSQFHSRMPAILHPAEYDEWIDRSETERPPVHLLRPYTGQMVIHEAHPKVGNVRNNGVEMLNSA